MDINYGSDIDIDIDIDIEIDIDVDMDKDTVKCVSKKYFFVVAIVSSELFRTMRSRDHDVVLVRHIIGLRCWEFGMGREWGGMGRGRSVYE
jgi:hypothetical protein